MEFRGIKLLIGRMGPSELSTLGRILDESPLIVEGINLNQDRPPTLATEQTPIDLTVSKEGRVSYLFSPPCGDFQIKVHVGMKDVNVRGGLISVSYLPATEKFPTPYFCARGQVKEENYELNFSTEALPEKG